MAFRSGLSDVIPPAWTAMFAPGELQTLISGAGAIAASLLAVCRCVYW